MVKALRIRYPNSFLKLLLIGFAFATLPLIIAFINANIAFDQFAKKSQVTISNAVEATRTSLTLQEQLHIMERSVRQYFVLYDDVFFKNYEHARHDFLLAIQHLNHLVDNPHLQKALTQLTQNELEIYENVHAAKDSTFTNFEFLDKFDKMAILVEAIIKQNNDYIDDTSNKLALQASESQSKFFLQSLILIPFTLLVTGIIAYMLGRPIQKMDTAITDLGRGDYLKTISIDGPGDLKLLGERLDWLRNELHTLKEQKQLFLQHISHELKTPLTAIREATELLTDGVGGELSPQQIEIAQILKDNSIKLQKMIENLLNFTKLESTDPSINFEHIDCKETIANVIKSHALSLRSKHLQVYQHIRADQFISDKQKFITILDNLLSNAVKYTPEKGKIIVSTKRDKSWQWLEIADNGPGLAEEDKHKLFDPFYHGKTLHQGLVGSTGLGLSITKNLVESMQGEIYLRDKSIGAHFVVRLPILND